MRARQAKAQEEMTAAEADSLARWRDEKAQNKLDDSSIEAMLHGTCFQIRVNIRSKDTWKSY